MGHGLSQHLISLRLEKAFHCAPASTGTAVTRERGRLSNLKCRSDVELSRVGESVEHVSPVRRARAARGLSYVASPCGEASDSVSDQWGTQLYAALNEYTDTATWRRSSDERSAETGVAGRRVE